MKKNYIRIIYVLIAVAAVNLIVMLSLIPGLPAEIPTHFNYRFEVDAMGSPWFMAVIPSITLVFTVAMAAEQKIRGKDYANNKPLTITAVAFVTLFTALGWTLYAMCSTGAQMGDVTTVPFDLIIGLGMPALFIVLGNYMPTIKPNRTFGMRIPATFRSEETWKKTHRFSGPVTVAGGLFSMVCTLVGYFTGAKWLILTGIFVGVIGSCLVSLIYALRLDRKMREV